LVKAVGIFLFISTGLNGIVGKDKYIIVSTNLAVNAGSTLACPRLTFGN
jgi:hypothetical protein